MNFMLNLMDIPNVMGLQDCLKYLLALPFRKITSSSNEN